GTRVSVEFELSLNAIEYEDVQVVPGGSRDVGRTDADEFRGVIPDNATIIELTNELSDEGYYIKCITKNSPRIGPDANLLSRCWYIEVRRYIGVFPIDFHLTLMGEEEYLTGIRARVGNTIAQLTVRSVYANDDMECQIEAE